jgi:U3 small nucleolar RNA-associated protein 4
VFRPGGSGVLVVTTNANILHELDVEEKRMGEWSRKHGSRLPQSFLEFPGGIQGLSFCPSGEATTLIAYSSK